MSHLKIQRKLTQSIRSKIYSEESVILKPRQSLGKILNDNISKRRRTTTYNSPDQSQQLENENELEEAKQVYKSKNTKNALVLFLKLFKKNPKNSQIPYFIGSCYLNESNFDEAIKYFRICLALDSSFNKNIYIYMAICYKSQRKLKNAIETLNSCIQKYPKFKDAYFYKGKILMKMQQFSEACLSFKKCIKINNENNDFVSLLLADCLQNVGNFEEALAKYSQLIDSKNEKFMEKAWMKKINLLIETKKPNEALCQIKKCSSSLHESPQLSMLRGICEYELENYNDAITLCELGLTSNLSPNYINKALKILVQISIKEKDFFGAEHLVLRAKFMNVNQKQFSIYYDLIEGINDLIKKKIPESEQKLMNVFKNCQKYPFSQDAFLLEASSPYYAYCLFSLEKYDQALEVYKVCQKFQPNDSFLNLYNKLICEGIIKHKNGEFSIAETKFRKAVETVPNKIEAVFLLCINIIQQNKKVLAREESRNQIFEKLSTEFQNNSKLVPPHSLFLFYESLTLLYQGKNACEVIDRAISSSEDEVSEYYFIQALAYSLSGKNMEGLEMLNKAIDLDNSIPQFFKQRSKYYYALQRFEEAVADIIKVLQQTSDDQAKLLLTFYYYMTDQFDLSLDLLNEVGDHSSQQKFKQFEMALNFRLNRWELCGQVGSIISAIIAGTEIGSERVIEKVKEKINQKQCYSEFTVYHLHIILAAYFFYQKQLDSSLESLFGALEQIQLNSEQNQEYSTISQILLSQLKFNIVLVTMQKESQQETKGFPETEKYMKIFISETEDVDFILMMNSLLKILNSNSNLLPHQVKSSQQTIKHIDMYSEMQKVSDSFPQTTIPIGNNEFIKTKFIVLYPQKLHFNIVPQFDESFLINFDIDKVQSKLCPPWFKIHKGQIFFTEHIRNESVIISETQRSVTPLISQISGKQNLKDKFKLDDQIERKLQKFIQKQSKKSSKHLPQKQL